MSRNTNRDVADNSGVDELTAMIKGLEPPVGLVDEATTQVLGQLEAESPKIARRRATSRWAWSAGLAAVLLISILLNLPGRESLVFADMVSTLQGVRSVRATGWVRDESGQRKAYQQWVTANGDLRAEIGEGESRTTVVVVQGKRMVQSANGPVYTEGTKAIGHRVFTLDEAIRGISQAYESPESWHSHWESSKEDIGDVVRFSYRLRATLGDGPGDLRHIIDVDKSTRLPLRSEVLQLASGRWIRVSDLEFREYDVPVGPDMFVLTGDEVNFDDRVKARFWFELGVNLSSIQIPAVLVPDSGVEVKWLTGDEPQFKNMTGGGSSVQRGGVTTYEFVSLPVSNLVRAVSGMSVIDNETSQTSVTLRFRAKTALNWRDKLAPVLAELQQTAEVTVQEVTAKKFLFKHDGRTLPPSSGVEYVHRVTAGQPAHYTYRFARCPLGEVVGALFHNSTRNGFNRKFDTEAYDEGASAQDDAFKTLVDLEFENETGSWQTNLELLKEKFGISLEIGTEKSERQMVRLESTEN